MSQPYNLLAPQAPTEVYKHLPPHQDGGGRIEVTKVLMADGSPQRTNDFQLTGPGYHYRIVRSAADLQKTLGELGKWDILLHALYLGNWQEDVCFTVPCIVEAFGRKKLRGVICTTSIEPDAKKFVSALRSAGVPCKWYPFMYSRPSEHNEVVLDFPLVVEGTTR